MSIEATSGYKLLPPYSYKLEPHHLNSVWITLARKKMFCNPLQLKHYLHSEPDFLGKSNPRGTVWSAAHKSQLMRRKYKISSNWSLMTYYFVMHISIDTCISASLPESYCYLILLSVLSVDPPITTIVLVADSVLVIQLSYLWEVKLSECYLQ